MPVVEQNNNTTLWTEQEESLKKEYKKIETQQEQLDKGVEDIKKRQQEISRSVQERDGQMTVQEIDEIMEEIHSGNEEVRKLHTFLERLNEIRAEFIKRTIQLSAEHDRELEG